MGRRKPVPSYRRQKRKVQHDLAFVELKGTRYYLGEYGSEESRRRYQRFLAELESGAEPHGAELDMEELLARFMLHAEKHYRHTHEWKNFRPVVRVVRQLYPDLPVSRFGPRAFKAVRSELVRSRVGGAEDDEKTMARSTVNQAMARLRRVFKWAVAEELVQPNVHAALCAVPPLKRGRTEARETEPVRPVDADVVEKTLEHVSRQVGALARLQQLTGARSGELVGMRPADVDTSGDVWVLRPRTHKGKWRGQNREIYLGPRAQVILRPFLKRPPAAPCFSPREAEEERRAKATAERTTPPGQGNEPGSNRKAAPRRRPRETYTVQSYARAIARAAEAAGVEHWTPHRLRHARGTEVRRLYGLEAAQLVLGHQKADVTQVYAEPNVQKAIDIAREIG